MATSIDIDLLRRNHLFGVLSDTEMAAVLEFARLRRVAAEERIFAKGDPGDSLYVLLRGRVAVQTESPDAKLMLLNILDAGAVFGEIAMLDGGERTATVMAQEASELLRIDRRDFMPFLETRPDLCIRLMGVLCQRVRWTSAIIEDTVFLNVPRRLAKRILMLAQTYGRQTEGGLRIATFVSQEDLANMLGVSREMVNKTLKSFQKAEAITYRNGYLVVKDESFLDQISR
ncbi:Crp/Fnr family transcriptional regulator [Niveispirillum irakense]|uniref:Crp/Fnr family transcriptional regulator n=1 Tax=Niveispirillum irakense TaxID=34011 RepID=UPI0004015B90|nr:Crp/Fnr family transcriptional regulator [Niveispirillum irakense]